MRELLTQPPPPTTHDPPSVPPQHIVVKTLIVSANFYEGWKDVDANSKKWFFGCIVISTIYPSLLIIDFAWYETHPGEVLVPWWITMFFDLSW